MKKLGLLVMPMMAISFLASCQEPQQIVQHIVTFEANGGAPHVDTQKVNDGGVAVDPGPLTKVGYDFKGWYTSNPNPTPIEEDKYDFTSKVTSDITLYAGYISSDINHYDFSFNGTGCMIFNDPQYQETDIDEGSNRKFTIAPSEGYKLPLAVTITEGSGCATYDKETITISNMDSNVVVTASATPIPVVTHDISFYKEKDDEEPYATITDIADGTLIDQSKLPSTPSKEGYSFIGWCTDTSGQNVFDFDNIKIYQDYTLYAGWKKDEPEPYYFDITTSGTHMKYCYDLEMKIPLSYAKASKLDNLVFYMDPINEENSVYYVAPSELNITTGGEALLSEAYKIEEISKDSTKRKVTIYKEYINGSMVIMGDAVAINYYGIQFPVFYGFKPIAIVDTYFQYDEDATIYFEAAPGFEYTTPLLTGENVYVDFTGKGDDWHSPIDDDMKDKLVFTHSGGKYYLTIKANSVQVETTNIIKVIARAKDYHDRVLDWFSWGKINSIAQDKNLLGRLFSVGDTKTIKLNDGTEYTVRIIGFYKDEVATENNEEEYAPITFEFANVINGFTTTWNGTYLFTDEKYHNYNFITQSTLNDCLQPAEGERPIGEVYKKIPSDLMQVIKSVTKLVDISASGGTYYPESYTTKLFPLSTDEINMAGSSTSTTAYPYYKTDYSKRRNKGASYWLRSPHTGSPSGAWFIDKDGNPSYNASVYKHSYAVAPAFCI